MKIVRGDLRWATAAVAAAAAAAAMLSGCVGIPKPTPIAQDDKALSITMTLLPGDTLNIDFYGAPELNTEQTIRRDGKISLKLVGDVQAAGRTPEELQRTLLSLFGAQMKVKAVNVVVTSAMPVFVTGSVMKPGRFELPRQLTALDAIMEAGGFDGRTAEVSRVVVIRHTNGKREGFVIDYKGALKGEPGDAFYLRPFDIVYVPNSGISKANQIVDQYINGMLPDFGMSVDSQGDVSVYR